MAIVLDGGSGLISAAGAPAFSAYLAGTQTGIASTVATKLVLDSKFFDTHNYFSTSNYRYTPLVAGYYQFNWLCYLTGTNLQFYTGMLYKNGVINAYGPGYNALATPQALVGGNQLVYMNGSTDYVELYGVSTASAGTITNNGSSGTTSFLSGYLVRTP